MHKLDALVRRIPLQPNQLEQTDLGNDEALASAGDHQSGNDGQSERDLELDGGAFAGPAEDIDNAADFLDVGLDHIHADAAPGKVGHRSRHREPGQEDEVQSLAIAQFLSLFRPQEPFLDGLLLDARDVDARPVVGDFDVDLPAFVIGAKAQSSLWRLARVGAYFRRLDAVVARVPNQVDERILDGFDDGPVEFRLLPFHLQLDLFPQGYGHIAHHARQVLPHHPDGLHAGLHDAFLQLGGNQVQPLRGRVEGGILALGVELEDLIAGQYQFPHQVHEFVEQPHPDPDVGIRHGGRLRGIPLGWLAFGKLGGAIAIRGFRQGSRRHAWIGLALGIGLRLRRHAQAFGQVLKAVRSFLPAGFDGSQHLSRSVHRLQNQGYQGWSELPPAVAQLAQEALRLVADSLQGGKREEAAGALDRVNGAEDACQQLRILGVLLEFDEFLIQTREVFMTLDQEFTNHILILHTMFSTEPTSGSLLVP